MTFPRARLATPAVLLALLLTGCTHGAAAPNTGATTPPAGGASGPPATTDTATTSTATPYEGTWSGTWSRTSPPQTTGTITFVLHQQGQSITGTVDVGGAACLTKGPVNGSVNGADISLHTVTPAASGGGQATGEYQGVLAGTKLSGSLTGGCSLGIGIGTWQVTRQ